ncbi:MAG: sigma-70 family RNA polymerase sigma factor [Chloroflexi bacterium]|nr:sigma-70 family RNA polymerase sigma factor [Chloroflexota bacterium]
MTDEQAILRCQDGEREAFRYLVERYKDVLYGTALLMMRNPTLAEEQVQEAFLAAWRGIKGFRPGRPFKPWVVRILVNKIVSLRRTRTLPTVPLEQQDPPEDVPQPAEAVEAQLDRQAIRQALARLTPDHREVIVLRYFADLTVPELAETIGVPLGTAKSRLHRALGNLRDELTTDADGEDDGDG